MFDGINVGVSPEAIVLGSVSLRIGNGNLFVEKITHNGKVVEIIEGVLLNTMGHGVILVDMIEK